MKLIHFLPRMLVRAFAGASVAFATSVAFAADENIDHTDKSFIKQAYEDGLAEIHMAGLGVAKTANADIKAFAEKLEADHGKATGELKALADTKKVSVATSPDLLDQGKEKLLGVKSGSSFDKAFIDQMVSDHKKAIESFEKAANDSKDPDVKAFAAKTLPTLRAHLSAAEDLQAKLGK